jgi:hypothetical protein
LVRPYQFFGPKHSKAWGLFFGWPCPVLFLGSG